MVGVGAASCRLHSRLTADIRTHNETAPSFIESHHVLDHGNRLTYIEATLCLRLQLVKVLVGGCRCSFPVFVLRHAVAAQPVSAAEPSARNRSTETTEGWLRGCFSGRLTSRGDDLPGRPGA